MGASRLQTIDGSWRNKNGRVGGVSLVVRLEPFTFFLSSSPLRLEVATADMFDP
jgi:hypothetical protein